MAYVHQEYPKHVHKFGGQFLEVNSKEAEDAAIKDGWSLKPVLEEASGDSKPIGAAVDLSKMSKAQLIQHAKDVHGADLDPSQKKDSLLVAIAALSPEQGAE